MIARMTVVEFLLYREMTLCQLHLLLVDSSLHTLASNFVITTSNIYINGTVVLSSITSNLPSETDINYLDRYATPPYILESQTRDRQKSKQTTKSTQTQTSNNYELQYTLLGQ